MESQALLPGKSCPRSLWRQVEFNNHPGYYVRRKAVFSGIAKYEEKIASNILTDRLAMLEREGILSKASDPGHKQKYIYSLTSKGIDLLPVMVEIGGWSLKHKPVDLKKHKHAQDLVKGGKELQKEIRKNLIKRHLK